MSPSSVATRLPPCVAIFTSARGETMNRPVVWSWNASRASRMAKLCNCEAPPPPLLIASVMRRMMSVWLVLFSTPSRTTPSAVRTSVTCTPTSVIRRTTIWPWMNGCAARSMSACGAWAMMRPSVSKTRAPITTRFTLPWSRDHSIAAWS